MNRDVDIAASRLTRRTVLAGFAAAPGAAAAQSFGQVLGLPSSAGPQTPPAPAAGAALAGAGRQGLVPKGYSERFMPVRDLIANGRYDPALAYFGPERAGSLPPPANSSARPPSTNSPQAKTLPAAIATDSFLVDIETGLIAFEAGRSDMAQQRFDAADEVVAPKDKPKASKGKQIVGVFSNGVKFITGKVIGNEEIGEYHRFDHEQILHLNYLSLSYLLIGDRKCYNVTRRCIDKQADLKTKFETQLAEYKAKYESEKSRASKVSDSERQGFDKLGNEFHAYDNIAEQVPNPYVNPLGDYLAGVIQEIASREQPSLRDNARISYENASALCGSAPQFAAAAAAMRRARVPAGERVAHVVVAEGFAPQRQVLTFGIPLGGRLVPLKIPIFTPIASSIDRIQIRTAASTHPTTLGPVGNVEAIILRDQHDRIPQTMFSVLTSLLASYETGELFKGMGLVGSLFTAARDANAWPDTRSWLSLPRRFHVARVVLPKGAESLRLEVIDRSGTARFKQVVAIDRTNPHTVIYARATDASLQVLGARRLWIDGRLEVSA